MSAAPVSSYSFKAVRPHRLLPPLSTVPSLPICILRRKRKRPLVSPPISRFLPSADRRWSVGLDMSIHSPGVVCWNLARGECHFFYLPTLETHHHLPAVNPMVFQRNMAMESSMLLDRFRDADLHRVSIRRLVPAKLSSDAPPVARFPGIATVLLNALDEVLDLHPSERSSLVSICLEEYTFQEDSSSMTGLAELGGVLKTELWQRGYQWRTMSNTTVKSRYGGHGKANKLDLFLASRRRFPFLTACLADYFHWDVEDLANAERYAKDQREIRKQQMTREKKSKSTIAAVATGVDASWSRAVKQNVVSEASYTVPHPVEDLVDALGLLWTAAVIDGEEESAIAADG